MFPQNPVADNPAVELQYTPHFFSDFHYITCNTVILELGGAKILEVVTTSTERNTF